MSSPGCILEAHHTTLASLSDNAFGNVTEAAISTTKVPSKIERTSNCQTDFAISLTTKIQEETASSTTMTRPESSSITTINITIFQASAVRDKYDYFKIYKFWQYLLYFKLHVLPKNVFILKAGKLFLSIAMV